MNKIINFFVKIYNFIRYDIWRITENELSRSRRISYRLVKVVVLATRGFINGRLNLEASALTYTILFAIIPMFALIFAIGKGFGVDDMIEKSLQKSLVAQSNLIPKVMEFVNRYLETTQGGLFIGVGIVILLISVMNFFIQVELAFNSIWQVRKPRAVINQLSIYFSAMLLIPIFIVFSSGLSIYINTILSKSILFDLLSPILRFLVSFAPFFFNWIIFTLMYLVIPNTKVKFLHALIAGIIAGSAFQLFQILYINGQVYLSRYNIVYGSFAAIPLLLLWLQISCLIVLLGAEISYASQNIQNYEYEIDTKNISIRYENFLTLFITYIIVKQFEKQQPALSSNDIASTNRLPIRLVNQILTKLVDSNVLIEVYNQINKIKCYQPAVDINQLTVGLLNNKIESVGSEHFLNDKNGILSAFWHKTLDIKQKSDYLADKVLVKDI